MPLDTTLSTGQDRLFQVTVTQGQTLEVDLTGSDPQRGNTLFLRYGALPSGSTYDASYPGAVQASQYAVIPSTTIGTYYILVHGQSEPGPGTRVTLLAHLLPFEITDVAPDEGGDSRYVTTTILGAEFDPQAIVKLVRPASPNMSRSATRSSIPRRSLRSSICATRLMDFTTSKSSIRTATSRSRRTGISSRMRYQRM
ncbi:MAG: PPC domain-containing protein [Bradyrhizobium sp.]